MTEVVSYFIGSIIALLALVLLTYKERRLGRRLFASRTRGKLDILLERMIVWVDRSVQHFVRYIVQLHWYYSIHSILKTTLRVIVACYTRIENMFERNRARTKKLRAEKRQMSTLNHLEQVSVHKAENALTSAEKKRLRKKKLEERY